MTKLTLTNCVQGNATLIENEFIDVYMAEANGDYVKVYLLLLRYLGDPSKEMSISALADALECTERDVVRALNYWKKKGLLHTESQKQVLDDNSRKDFKEIKHVAEMYLQKTLTKTEADAIIYFYDELAMSADLIEYLFEYCVENGHKSIRYIRKVAMSWSDEGIVTVEQAKAASGKYSRQCYTVLNAYGIKGRAPAASELAFIRRWYEEYGFSTELVAEACDRTMNAIHQPSFEYTDSILLRWMDKGVKTLEDVKELDIIHLQDKDARKTAASRARGNGKGSAATKNKFNNFEGRKYQDMDELARKLIETQ